MTPVAEDGRIRSFVAIDLDPAVRAGLEALLRELAHAGGDVRWARREGLHITLKFLGWVEPERLERVHGTVRGVAEIEPVMEVPVRGLGAFPSLRRPRVLWVGAHDARLTALAARLDAALVPLGFAPEARSFTPHVTLGRVGSPRGWPRVEAALAAHRDDEFGITGVEQLVIYRSTLRPDGAVYTPLWTTPLAQNTR